MRANTKNASGPDETKQPKQRCYIANVKQPNGQKGTTFQVSLHPCNTNATKTKPPSIQQSMPTNSPRNSTNTTRPNARPNAPQTSKYKTISTKSSFNSLNSLSKSSTNPSTSANPSARSNPYLQSTHQKPLQTPTQNAKKQTGMLSVGNPLFAGPLNTSINNTPAKTPTTITKKTLNSGPPMTQLAMNSHNARSLSQMSLGFQSTPMPRQKPNPLSAQNASRKAANSPQTQPRNRNNTNNSLLNSAILQNISVVNPQVFRSRRQTQTQRQMQINPQNTTPKLPPQNAKTIAKTPLSNSNKSCLNKFIELRNWCNEHKILNTNDLNLQGQFIYEYSIREYCFDSLPEQTIKPLKDKYQELVKKLEKCINDVTNNVRTNAKTSALNNAALKATITAPVLNAKAATYIKCFSPGHMEYIKLRDPTNFKNLQKLKQRFVERNAMYKRMKKTNILSTIKNKILGEKKQ